MKKNETKSRESLYLILNLVLAVVSMVLSLTLLGGIVAENQNTVSLFLGLSILSQVLFQCLVFVVQDRKRDKIRATVLASLYVVAAVIAFAAKSHWSLFYIATFLVVIIMALTQFLLIEKEKTKKGAITNILLCIVLVALSVATLIGMDEPNKLYITIVATVLFLLTSLKRLLFPTFKLEKIKLLLDILIKTHAFDALICLLAFIIAFSFMFPMVEPNITNFWDAMWYCFAVVTTIGFGDFYATTIIGRVLTVVLGIYGIVVVAILTSVIVNFYSAVSSREKAKDIIE